MMSVRHGREICSPIVRRQLRLPGSVPHHLDVPRVPVGCRAPLRLGQGTVTRLGAGPQDPKRRPSLGLGWSQTVHADLRTDGRTPSDLILTFIRKLSARPLSPRRCSNRRKSFRSYGPQLEETTPRMGWDGGHQDGDRWFRHHGGIVWDRPLTGVRRG